MRCEQQAALINGHDDLRAVPNHAEAGHMGSNRNGHYDLGAMQNHAKKGPNTEAGGKVSFTEDFDTSRPEKSVSPRRNDKEHRENRDPHWEMDVSGLRTQQKHTLEEFYAPDELKKARVFSFKQTIQEKKQILDDFSPKAEQH